MTPASLTAISRHFYHIRETLGPNRGFFVSMLQRFCHGKDGDAWCADFVSFVLDIAYMGKPPLRKTGSTQEMLSEAKVKGFFTTTPRADDLFFFVREDGTPHHVGIVTDVDSPGLSFIGIAGNTSDDGTSSNGTGVFEHAITLTNGVVFVRLP